MPNQRDIADALQISQATVSLALRGSQLISPEVREQVRETAKQLGYQANPYVDALMARIRTGKPMTERGVIALIVATHSQSEWHEIESYQLFHQGLIQRAIELGYRIETHYLKERGMSDAKLDRILYSRGIKGLVLASPGDHTLKLTWERYSAVVAGFVWEELPFTRINTDQCQNFIVAFEEIIRRGYKRIGTVLSSDLVSGNRLGTNFYRGFLECQDRVPPKQRVPLFAAHAPLPGEPFTPQVREASKEDFRRWCTKWQPEVIVTVDGKGIKDLLSNAGLRIPADVGVVDIAQASRTECAGIDEKSDVAGATVIEQLAGQIAHNENGPPPNQKVMLIEGSWVDGPTLRRSATS